MKLLASNGILNRNEGLNFVKKPITITITAEQEKKARALQAKLISVTNTNWSFSQVVGILLDEGLKNTSFEKAKKLKV